MAHAYGDNAQNLYDPKENLFAFVVHTAAKAVSFLPSGYSNCGGGLERAFGSGTLAKTYKDTSILKGYRHQAEAAISATNSTGKDDDYELLAKGVGAYNGGNGFTNGRSWPDVLKETGQPPPKKFWNTSNYCISCLYSIQIRNEKYGLPYRTYIWKGGKYDDDLKMSDGVTPDSRAGQDWCFAYGEKEWVSPEFNIPLRGGGTRPAMWKDYLDRAKKQSSLQIPCE